MLPTLAELEKLIGETRHRRGQPCGRGAGRRALHRFRRGGAHLLDPEGRGRPERCRSSMAATRPGQAEGNTVETGPSKPSPKIFTATLNKALLVERARSRRSNATAARRWSMRGPRPFFAGKEKAPAAQGLWPHSGRGQPRQRDVLRREDQPPEAAGRACRARRDACRSARRSTYCNTGHWAATDWFVLSEILGRKDVKLYSGSMVEWTADAQPPACLRPHQVG